MNALQNLTSTTRARLRKSLLVDLSVRQFGSPNSTDRKFSAFDEPSSPQKYKRQQNYTHEQWSRGFCISVSGVLPSTLYPPFAAPASTPKIDIFKKRKSIPSLIYCTRSWLYSRRATTVAAPAHRPARIARPAAPAAFHSKQPMLGGIPHDHAPICTLGGGASYLLCYN